MKISKVLGILLLVGSTSVLFAQNATVLRMTGAKTATVLLPDSPEEIALMEGQEVPVGALITVGADTKLFLRTFSGAITTAAAGAVFAIEEIKTNADGTETTSLALRGGDLVANLAPAKKGTHDYRVRTPKGVAAARGTTYSVSVAGQAVLVTVSGGVVSFEVPGIPIPVEINPGQASTGGAAQPLATVLATATPEVQGLVNQALQATAAAVASLVGDPQSGVTTDTLDQVVQAAANASVTSHDGGALVAIVAAAATQANAVVAQQVVQSAVAATATTGNASAIASTVVASVARVAATAPNAAAVGSIVNTLTQTATNAASRAGGNVTIDTSSVLNAVNQAGPADGATGGIQGGRSGMSQPIIQVPVDSLIVSPSN